MRNSRLSSVDLILGVMGSYAKVWSEEWLPRELKGALCVLVRGGSPVSEKAHRSPGTIRGTRGWA